MNARTRIALAVAVFLAACTEPKPPAQAPAPIPLEARLDVSDSSAAPGKTVFVTVHASDKKVASMTGRIVYDSTALSFLSEETLRDGATRVLNPATGALRFATILSGGFEDGRLYVLRFTPLKPNGLSSLRLVIDEIHTGDRKMP
jgi:hypothetical protein